MRRFSEVIYSPMPLSACTRSSPHAPWFLVPAANRISMPTSRPTDRDTITPVTELIDSRIRMADEM